MQNEIQTRLDVDIERFSKLQQNIRDTKRFAAIHYFDFRDNKQEGNEINVNEILGIAENNKTKSIRTPILEVITDGYRDIFPHILEGELIVMIESRYLLLDVIKTQMNKLNTLTK